MGLGGFVVESCLKGRRPTPIQDSTLKAAARPAPQPPYPAGVDVQNTAAKMPAAISATIATATATASALTQAGVPSPTDAGRSG